jgi:hypothetical protein
MLPGAQEFSYGVVFLARYDGGIMPTVTTLWSYEIDIPWWVVAVVVVAPLAIAIYWLVRRRSP